MGFVRFNTENGMHVGFSSYGTIAELELLIKSLIHDGYVIEEI